MEIYFLNYADDRFGHRGGCFSENQARLNGFAKKQGIKNIVSWTFDDFKQTEFYQAHKEYFDKDGFNRGYAWKPYIVLELLKKIKYGDIVFYYDSVPYEINLSIEPLVKLCIRNNGTLFHQWGIKCNGVSFQEAGDKNSTWAKRDAFVYMGCDEPKYHNAVALQSTWFFIQKNDFNIKFVEEWLSYNLDERIASIPKPSICGLPELPGFVANRADQTILTNLCVKYNIKTFFGAGGWWNKPIDNFTLSLTWRGRLILLVRMLRKRKIRGTRAMLRDIREMFFRDIERIECR